MNRHISFCVLMACTLAGVSAPLYANPSLNADGYSTTIGPVTNRSNLQSSMFNPANGRQMVAEDESLRFGVLPNIGGSIEFGEIGKLSDLKDSIQTSLDGINNACKLTPAEVASVPVLGTQAQKTAEIAKILERCIDSANQQLTALNNGAWKNLNTVDVQLQLNGGLPLTPLVYRATPLSDAWTLSDSVYLQSRFRVLEGALSLNTGQRQIDTNNPVASTVPLELQTKTAFDAMVATINRLSLGYSFDMNRFAPVSFAEDGSDLSNLDSGLRLNYYSIRSGRILQPFLKSGEVNTSTPTFNYNNTSVLGVDWGLLWTATHYQVGATVYNLNSPSFSYPEITIPADLAGQAVANGKITLKPQVVLEGSIYDASKTFMLQTSYATNPTLDFIGQEQQWATVSTGFYPDSYLIPAVRLGYQKNMVGTKLSRVAAGFTFFGVFNVDGFASVEKTEGVPRAMGFALSVTEKF